MKVMRDISVCEVDVQYPEKLHDLHNGLSFLPERMKIENIEKLTGNLHDKAEYVIHIRNLKQPLNHELVLKNVRRVIKVSQKVWLKPNIGMNIKLRKKQKLTLRKTFSI